MRFYTAAVVVIAVAAAAVRIEDVSNRWWLAGAAIPLIALFAWWRGLYLTTMGARLLALIGRNRGWRRHGARRDDLRTTVMLRIDSGIDHSLPLPVIRSYLDRYGIRCRSIRVTSRDPDRVTWISLTVGAADNLTALQGRSSSLPLCETASVLRRRLADHLREIGWTVDCVQDAESPVPEGTIRERWRAVQSGSGYVAAYRITVTLALPEVLEQIHQLPAEQTWTAIEFTDGRNGPQVSVACALVTADRPTRRLPIDGITPESGRHRPALEVMKPSSAEQLEPPPVPVGDALAVLPWPVASAHASAAAGRHSAPAELRNHGATGVTRSH